MSLGGHGLSWSNWIMAGKNSLNPDDRKELERRIGSWSAGELIDAVTFLLEKLKLSNCYTAFMDKTIGSLHPIEPDFKAALCRIWRAGDLIATTNYDLQIEESLHASPVSYSVPAEILSIIRGDADNKVIHLHGVYDKLHGVDDIVADDPQYKGILANAGAQFIQNLLSTHPLIIVGCGGTMEDPNLSGFLSFVAEKLGVTDIPYFCLLKNGDLAPALPANAVSVFYGDDYGDLPIFLAELSALRLRKRTKLRSIMAVNPYQNIPTVTSAFGRLHFSNEFNRFVGREEELRKLNDFLEQDVCFSWWTVLGDGGIGKSRLILEWLRNAPANWFGFFARKNPEEARNFKPFTDTIIVFDYVLGKEHECAEMIAAFREIFSTFSYKLRILFVEREQRAKDSDWLTIIKRAFYAEDRLLFDSAVYDKALMVEALSVDHEIRYVENYLSAYLPLVESNDFIETCKANIQSASGEIEKAFRTSVEPACYRPLYLSIFIEVWLSKEGELSLSSAEELLGEYLHREMGRWRKILGDGAMVDSYMRLLAMACAIERFNLADVYGENYLEEDCRRLTQFFDDESGKPGADNVFSDLFVSMDELVEDTGKDTIAEAFFNPENGAIDEEDINVIRTLDEVERFAYFTPYVKLHADPQEVYLQMKVGAGAAKAEEVAELDRVRENRIWHVAALPDHAWIIEPVFPDIIKEFIVTYTVNARDIGRFTKLARSNSILGFGNFLSLALDDWPANKGFQKMIVTPPAEMLNYFEYYISLLRRIDAVEDIQAVEQVLIDSEPCFQKYEMELWRRIAVVLTDRNDVERLYESGVHFIQYMRCSADFVPIRDEAVDVIEAYCIGIHNASQVQKYADFLQKIETAVEILPENQRLGYILCQNYSLLSHLKLYHNKKANVGAEWDKVLHYIEQYGWQDDMCRTGMEAAYDYLGTLIGGSVERIRNLEEQLTRLYERNGLQEVAEVAALCAINSYAISYKKGKLLAEEYDKIRKYFSEFPDSMRIRSAYVAVSNYAFAKTSDYRNVPDKLLAQAKEWSLQYPGEIEFQEGYFGLLMSRLEYAQSHDMRNEQRRTFKEMEAVAQRADYSSYNEENQLIESVQMLRKIYGYR